MKEVWKAAVGYEGIYEVSNLGEVRTVEGKTTHSVRGGVRTWKQRILKQRTSRHNTLRVTLYKNKRHKTINVHRLIAMAFLEKVEGKEFVNHIDGDSQNNRVDNLEWCTTAENNQHAIDTGLNQCGHKVVLLNMQTNELMYFQSLTKASQHIGKSKNHLSVKIQRGIWETEEYMVFLQPDKALKVSS
jgi:hypothetical protein